MPENDLLAQHQRALGILCGLHPSVAVDGAPEDVAVRIFRHTQAERTLLQERVALAAFSVLNHHESPECHFELKQALMAMGYCPRCEWRPCECEDSHDD